MNPVLYVVPTPIGNMNDLTPRARSVLEEVAFVACEDTRVGGKLMMLAGIKKPLCCYQEHNKQRAGEQIVKRIKSGESCALITDAGTPAVSDPGEELVALCHENGVAVIPLAGACAATVALSASGLPSRRFCFEGFLPEGNKEREEYFSLIAKEPRTMIFYSAPHDLASSVALLLENLGDRRVTLCKELTKLNERIMPSTLSALCESVSKAESIKGEYVLVVSGYTEKSSDQFWFDMTLEEQVEHYINLGLSNMDAIKQTAKDRGKSKNEIYKQLLDKEK